MRRSAETPTEIPPKGWLDIAWRIKDEVSEDRIGLIAAGIAFYGLLALFPALSALIALSALFVEPQLVAEQTAQLAGLIPQDVIDIVTQQVQDITGSGSTGLGLAALVGFLLALYSASKGTASLIEGMNAAYDENETRGFFKSLFVRLTLTVLIIFGMTAALLITVSVPTLTSIVSASPILEGLVTVAVYVVLFALAVVGLGLIYRYGPSRDNPEFSWVSLGAIVACVIWVVASAGFAFYVSTFGTYNETFGALGGVVVLLMWFWISAFIVLLGAELNSEAEAQTRYDTTVGKELPMGERDATKADELGETVSAT